MKSNRYLALAALLVFALMAFVGCSQSTGPVSAEDTSLNAESVVANDLQQLAEAHLLSSDSAPALTTDGVFSIGWNQFVGPHVLNAGTIGKAFAVVHDGTVPGDLRPGGIDLGTVSLAYDSSSIDLDKRTTPAGLVLYSTFGHGLRAPQTLPANIPFIANGVYTFSVSGSATFGAGTFAITAPASLLNISSNSDGDEVSPTSDLVLAWTGGSPSDSVLVRVVSHMRPMQGGRSGMGPGGKGPHGPMGGGPGHEGPRPGMAPDQERGLVKKVANTGSATISAAELQSVVGSTGATELMVGVTQAIEQQSQHAGKSITVLLRNGDRVVLRLK